MPAGCRRYSALRGLRAAHSNHGPHSYYAPYIYGEVVSAGETVRGIEAWKDGPAGARGRGFSKQGGCQDKPL